MEDIKITKSLTVIWLTFHFYYLYLTSKDYQKNENEDKKDEEFLNHKEEMRIENERERTSSMMDCKHKFSYTSNGLTYNRKAVINPEEIKRRSEGIH